MAHGKENAKDCVLHTRLLVERCTTRKDLQVAPCPLQSLRHVPVRQPPNPAASKHVHTPVEKSQVPQELHEWSQSNSEQSSPVRPGGQLHQLFPPTTQPSDPRSRSPSTRLSQGQDTKGAVWQGTYPDRGLHQLLTSHRVEQCWKRQASPK